MQSDKGDTQRSNMKKISPGKYGYLNLFLCGKNPDSLSISVVFNTGLNKSRRT